MTREEINKINMLEGWHWWYRGTREICFDIISRHIPDRPIRILDIGCGTGGNMLTLQRFGNVEGIDVDDQCVSLCRQKGLEVRQGSMFELTLPPRHYDMVTMFDVLNQSPPDAMSKVLGEIRRGLADGGIIALREPAMAIASGRHDEAVNIQKRFDRAFMTELLKDSGFEIVAMTYLNTLLLVPIVILRKLQVTLSSAPRSDVRETSWLLNAALLGILRLERRLIRLGSLPVGVSIFAMARKR